MNIPTFIKEFRLSAGMSQSEFATFIGCTKQMVAKAEQGQTSHPRAVIKGLLPKLGVDERERLKNIIAEGFLNSLK